MNPRDVCCLRLGRQLLAVAVLCILVTAPPGAALIVTLGPRLLQKEALSKKVSFCLRQHGMSELVSVCSCLHSLMILVKNPWVIEQSGQLEK